MNISIHTWIDKIDNGWKHKKLQNDIINCSKSHTRLLMEPAQNSIDLQTQILTARADRDITVFGGRGQIHDLCRSCNCSAVIIKWGCSMQNLRIMALAATYPNLLKTCMEFLSFSLFKLICMNWKMAEILCKRHFLWKLTVSLKTDIVSI